MDVESLKTINAAIDHAADRMDAMLTRLEAMLARAEKLLDGATVTNTLHLNDPGAPK